MHRARIARCSTFMSESLPRNGVTMTFKYDPQTGPVINGPISHAAARLEAYLASDIFRPQLDDSPRSKVEHASLIRPIAEGLFALAVAGGTTYVSDIADKPSEIYGATSVHCGDRAKFFMPNTLPFSVVNAWASPGNVWGPSGMFELSAIILEVGSNRYGPLAELTLALPTWNTSADPENAHEFALIKFDTRGHAREEKIEAYVEGAGFRATVEPAEGLKYLLGIEPPVGLHHSSSSGAGISSCLGFPFAEEVLLSKMSSLKDYLVACAIGLGEQNDD